MENAVEVGAGDLVSFHPAKNAVTEPAEEGSDGCSCVTELVIVIYCESILPRLRFAATAKASAVLRFQNCVIFFRGDFVLLLEVIGPRIFFSQERGYFLGASIGSIVNSRTISNVGWLL